MTGGLWPRPADRKGTHVNIHPPVHLRLRHIALVVGGLAEAEAHYTDLFGMTVLFRQAERDGLWITLAPGERSAEGMVALERDDLVLALFSGPPVAGQLHAIGLFAGEDEIAAIASRLPADTLVEARRPDWLAFVDRYGVRWQLTTRRYGTGSR